MADTGPAPTPARAGDLRAVRWVILWTLVPLGLGVVMFFVTPTYFRPMFNNFLGLVMLAATAGLTCVGAMLGMTAVKAIEQRKKGLGWTLLILQLLFFWLPTLWIVLLGPAALILMQPRT